MFKLSWLIDFLLGPRLYFDMGGGSSQPTSSNVQTTDLPEWVKPYAKDVLSKGQALTNQDYTAYGGNQVAGLSDLQKSAMNTVSSPEQFGKTVQGYMSPYMENVIEAQKRSAIQQGGIDQATLAAKGAMTGGFGGSGTALQGAMQNRNLAQQLSDIDVTGRQNAFQQAVGQANTAVGQQMQLGGVQQAQEQRNLDVDYQKFLTQKNYPYQQLSYMQNLLRGTPMGMNSQSQVYQGPTTMGQLLTAGGMGAYGLSKLAAGNKEGGLMQSYADGGSVGDGLSVLNKFNSPDAMMEDMVNLSVEQLQQIIENPATPAEGKAAQQMLAIKQADFQKAEAAMQASEQNGLAGAFNQVPYSQRENIVRAAGGGILAFAKGGGSEDGDDDNVGSSITNEEIMSLLNNKDDEEGSGAPAFTANPKIGEIANTLLNTNPKSLTPVQFAALKKYNIQQAMKDAGPNTGLQDYQKFITKMQGEGANALEQGKGIAALQAAAAMLQPGGFARGLANAGATFGKQYGEALQADRASKHYLAQAQFNLADAQRKERMGFSREAEASALAYNKNMLDSQKAKALAQAKAGQLLNEQDRNRAIALRAAGAGKIPPWQTQLYADTFTHKMATEKPNEGESPDAFQKRMRYEAGKETAGAVKDQGPGALNLGMSKVYAGISKTAEEEARKLTNQEAVAKNIIGSKDADTKMQEMFERNYKKAVERGAKTVDLAASDVFNSTPTPRHGIPLSESKSKSESESKGSSTPPPASTNSAQMTDAQWSAAWNKLKPGQTMMGKDGVMYKKTGSN